MSEPQYLEGDDIALGKDVEDTEPESMYDTLEEMYGDDLHWDMHDGFEITWLDMERRFITAPAWADKIEEDGEMSVGFFLDSLKEHSRKETP